MGQDTAAAAASALRLLNSPDLRHHPRTAPTGPRRATPATPGTPLDLALVDYLAEHVTEVVTHTRELAGPVPLPEAVEHLYAWYLAHTGSADRDQQTFRDTLIETHRLEHLVRLGETDEVCKHPCPGCGCWGLMWGGNRARCSNRRCRTPDGMSSTWSLARLAAQKVRRTEIWRRNAT